MKRMSLACLLALSAVALAVPAAPARTPRSAAPPRAALQSFSCIRSADRSRREISVQSVMRPVPGTQKLLVRFQLYVTGGPTSSATQLVRGGDLGHWISPANPTLGQRSGDIWIVPHPVSGLVAPGRYRFRVSFRWLDATGHVLAGAVRWTGTCREPDYRPDLEILSPVSVQPAAGRPAKNLYVVAVRNRGRSPAVGPFEVELIPGGSYDTEQATVSRLSPGATTSVSFMGPACSSLPSPPMVVVDPQDVVGDADPSNNTLAVTCPPAPSDGSVRR